MSVIPFSRTQWPEGNNSWLYELKNQFKPIWGAKVIDHLSHDLRNAFPDMKGFSPRNLKYMRSFAESWSGRAIVQEVLAQLPWYHQLALLDKLVTPQLAELAGKDE